MKNQALGKYLVGMILCASAVLHTLPPICCRAEGEELHVKVAVLTHFPPQYETSKSGEPSGFAVDVVEAVAELADFKIEYVVLENWSALFEAMKSGRADLVPNMGITDRRKEWFLFTRPVETFSVSIFVRNNSHEISEIADLSGKKIAVVKLNIGEVLVEKIPDADVANYDHVEDALFGLLSGNADALIFPEPVLWKIARDAGIDDRISVVGRPMVEVRRGMSVAKGNFALLRRIDDALKRFLKSDAYTAIYSKWYAKPQPFWSARKVALYMGALTVLAVVLMAFWRYRSVMRLNRRLKENIARRKTAERKLRKSHEELEMKVCERTRDLQEALSKVKTLSGLLPICTHCKKIRDDQGYWNQIEAYIEKHSDAAFSHSICRECAKKYYPDLKLYDDD